MRKSVGNRERRRKIEKVMNDVIKKGKNVKEKT